MKRLGVSAIGCSHEIDRSAVVDASSRLHFSVGRVIRCRAEKNRNSRLTTRNTRTQTIVLLDTRTHTWYQSFFDA